MATTGQTLRSEGLAVWRGERCLFEQLDFELAASQLALVIGPNGAGKTTLLRVLAGLADPSAGDVTWAGTRIGALDAERRADIAYRGHLDSLKKELTVRENLEFHASLWRRTPSLEPLLAELKLERAVDVRARHLSAGQRRRVALAMLRISNARLWLLDEPVTNLDSDGRALVVEWTRRHLENGGMAVVATHQPDDFAAAPGTLVIEMT